MTSAQFTVDLAPEGRKPKQRSDGRTPPAHGGRKAEGPDRARRRTGELAQDVPSPDPNPVTVVLRHAHGRLEQAQAPWLISAEGACSLDIFLCVFQAPEGRTKNSPGLQPWESKDDMSRQAATPVATLSAV